MLRKKLLFLALLLLVPAVIFIMLKFYGSNVYEVPVLKWNDTCENNVQLALLPCDSAVASVVSIKVESTKAKEIEQRIWGRLEAKNAICITKADTGAKNCNDQVSAASYLLLDTDKRLRGIYFGTEREEMDRMMVEIDLILRESK